MMLDDRRVCGWAILGVRRNSYWRLEFPVSITGPLALGFACHYGLGLFRPLPPAEGAG